MASPSKPSNVSKQPVNKKVARAARAGGGPVKRSRRRLDSFTITIIGIIFAGVALIGGSVYGRRILESAPFVGTRAQRTEGGETVRTGPYVSKKLRAAEDDLKKLLEAKKPDQKKIAAAQKKLEDMTADTHWHSAYGIYQCDKYLDPVDGTEFPDPVGLHSHDDGLIHIHPFLLRVSGRKARLGDWMEATFISANSKQLKFPTPGKRPRSGQVSEPADMVTLKTKTACKDKKGKAVDAQVSLYVWESEKDKTASVYSSGFGDIRVGENQIYAFVIAPKGTKIPKPPAVANLDSPSDVVSPLPATEGAPIGGATPTTTPSSPSSTVVTVGDKPAAVEVGKATTTIVTNSAASTTAASTTAASTPTTTKAG